MNKTQAVIDYSLNRFCPIAMVIAIIFLNFSLDNWQLYALGTLLFFMDRYQFKVGYSVGYCEASGIDPTSDDPIPPEKK